MHGMRSRTFWWKLALAALLLLFIWGNSMLPGSLSSRESRLVHRVLEPIALPVEQRLEAMGFSVDPDHMMRKTAHFAEYLCLGAALFLLLLGPDGRSRLPLTAGLSLLAALCDEGIQMFSEARGPSLSDVALDFVGACVGIALAALVVRLVRAARRKKTE